MGGACYACPRCRSHHFAFHSCNHKCCPRCGKAATAAWVQRALLKQVNAPYFMVTFTLPQELRSCFFGPFAKEFYDIFFAATSSALAQKLATAKGFNATVSGFLAVLHAWGQQMQFHPHIHFLVPGAGLNSNGKVVTVRKADYLVHLPLLQAAFRDHFRLELDAKDWQVDPAVWTKSWGVHIRPAGSGSHAVRYLGNYVARSVISDRRIVSFTDRTVTFLWKDRADNQFKPKTVSGTEFVRRYLRHVLPRSLRSIRYYGYCHPAAIRNRERVRMFTGSPILFGPHPKPLPAAIPTCPSCKTELALVARFPRSRPNRGPPNFNIRSLYR